KQDRAADYSLACAAKTPVACFSAALQFAPAIRAPGPRLGAFTRLDYLLSLLRSLAADIFKTRFASYDDPVSSSGLLESFAQVCWMDHVRQSGSRRFKPVAFNETRRQNRTAAFRDEAPEFSAAHRPGKRGGDDRSNLGQRRAKASSVGCSFQGQAVRTGRGDDCRIPGRHEIRQIQLAVPGQKIPGPHRTN